MTWPRREFDRSSGTSPGFLDGAPPGGRQHAKVELLREALQEHPLALWIDADVLRTRDDEDVSIHLHLKGFQELALEQVPLSTA